MITEIKTFYRLRLSFKSGLRISDGTEEGGFATGGYIRSDTFAAAISSTLLGQYQTDIPAEAWACSSFFPFCTHKSSYQYFYPKLVMPRLQSADPEPGLAKKIKAIKWLDEAFFEAVLNNEEINYGENREYIKGAFLSKIPDFVPPVVNEIITANRRSEGEETVFYKERVRFAGGCGLHALLYINNSDTLDMLNKALKLLADNGIGNDRSTGNGIFEYELEPMQKMLHLPDQASHALNLSLFLPQSKQQLIELTKSPESAFQPVKRGGWIGNEQYSGLRKKSVYMMAEGAVVDIHTNSPFVMGGVCNLTPDMLAANTFMIQRNGRAIWLPYITPAV